jgi:NADH:ubiquinone oxidoreductase subunit 4 (subunit M)
MKTVLSVGQTCDGGISFLSAQDAFVFYHMTECFLVPKNNKIAFYNQYQIFI